MAHRIKITQSDKIGPVFYWATFGLACLGVLDATYLLVYKLTNNNALCMGSGGCHDVNFSSYSEIGGIPVSIFGIFAFLVIAGILLLEQRLKIAKENGSLAIFGISSWRCVARLLGRAIYDTRFPDNAG